MAVTVTDRHSNKIRHANGAEINVVDGHLHVYESTRSVLAVHAPGQWLQAQVDEDQK